MSAFWNIQVASNYLSRMMRRMTRKATLQCCLWWLRTLPVSLELECIGADFSNQGSFWETSSPLALVQLRWTQSQIRWRARKICAFQPDHSISHSTVTLDHITHIEIQRNRGNSKKTVVNSGGPLTKFVTMLCRDTIISECSNDTLEIWNLNRMWVGKWLKENFPSFY